MTDTDLLVLERETPLSQSLLWQWNQDFYLNLGIKAWEKSVPHYVTSNPFIANSYAEIILEFISEWVAKNPDAVQSPFYLLELGAGHGKFSFYLLKRLFDLRARWPLGLKLCYIISDFSEKNRAFFSSHPNFEKYVAEGSLDFACFDLHKRNSIYLDKSQKKLSSDDFKNPLIVCANYILDSIKADSFYVDDRYRLNANLVNIKDKSNNLRDCVPVKLNELLIEFTAKAIGPDHYEERIYNHILSEYNQQLKKQSFNLPVETFRLIDHLNQLANGRLLFIASDKGYVSCKEFSAELNPMMAIHEGCFSLMANFDALTRYFKFHKGDAFVQSLCHNGLATCAYFSGLKFADFPKTELCVKNVLNRFSPRDYLNLVLLIDEKGRGISLECLVSYLGFGFYDPYIFNCVVSQINLEIGSISESLKLSLKSILHLVADQYYYMPSDPDFFFNIALVFHNLGEYQEALNYYQKSELIFGGAFNTLYNLGLCHYHLDKFHGAECYFAKALTLRTDAKTKEWLSCARKKNGHGVWG